MLLAAVVGFALADSTWVKVLCAAYVLGNPLVRKLALLRGRSIGGAKATRMRRKRTPPPGSTEWYWHGAEYGIFALAGLGVGIAFLIGLVHASDIGRGVEITAGIAGVLGGCLFGGLAIASVIIGRG